MNSSSVIDNSNSEEEMNRSLYNKQDIKIGPYPPHPDRKTIFCMAGDEPLMFQPNSQLNDVQRSHVAFMKDDVLPFSMSMIPISNRSDVVVLDRRFLENKNIFDWYLSIYEKMGLSFSNNLIFSHSDRLYSDAISATGNGDTISVECYSYLLAEMANIDDQLKASKIANSKICLAEGAEKFGFNIPRSIIRMKNELNDSIGKDFQDNFFIKCDGLGGGFNILQAASMSDCNDFIKPFGDKWKFVIQEKATQGIGASIDMLVFNDGEEIISARKQLTKSNKYIGNIFHEQLPSKMINEIVTKIANYVRSAGYSSEQGFICGIDLFLDEDDYTIIEVNARWTGGLPAALLLKKLNIDKQTIATFVFEIISPDRFSAYKTFCEDNLYQGRDCLNGNECFKIMPVSFAAYGFSGNYCLAHIILGNYDQFLIAHNPCHPT
jgi:predicted ATP-grasp superfamily ATP-dependent carboligase